MDDMQPGQVIHPRATTDDPQPAQPAPDGAPQPERPDEAPGDTPEPVLPPSSEPEPVSAQEPAQTVIMPAPQPMTMPEPTAAAEAQPDGFAAPDVAQPALPAPTEPATAWQYQSQPDYGLPADGRAAFPDELSWTGSEFAEHQKGASWYGGLAVAAVLAAALDYLITKDWLSPVVILVAAAGLGVMAGRKPRTQSYTLNHQGLQLGEKLYHFQDYKNFSVIEEPANISVSFMPLKRFVPPLVVYVTPDMEDQVVDFLSEMLPFVEHQGDALDSLMRRLRF